MEPRKSCPRKAFGLRNLGNTCYLNAVMQACSSLREFVEDLCSMTESLPACKEGKLFSCSVEILQQMTNSSSNVCDGPLSPCKLREQIAAASPMFGSNQQQDAHEFFLEYVNQLHDEMVAASAATDSCLLATHLHLDSKVRKRLQCNACGKHHDIDELFRDFSIDFEGSEQRSACTLASMVQAYFAQELVEVKCSHCEGAVARMEKTLVSPPRTLVLHLKRFVPNLQKQRYDKRHQRVDFPLRFDLQTAVRIGAAETGGGEEGGGPAPPALLYNLRALVAHDGASPHSGHYVCYARAESGTWKLYDDSVVRDLGTNFDPKHELGQSAYMLFYVLDQEDMGK